MIKIENDTLTMDNESLEKMAIEVVMLLSDIPEIINHINLIDVFKDVLAEEPKDELVKSIIADLSVVRHTTNRLKKSFALFFGTTDNSETEKNGGNKHND